MKNPENYLNHQLNTSKAKAAFLFPKEKRFNYRTKFITQSFYELPSTKNQRATSFGYGNKSTLLNKSQSPPPGAYKIKGNFQNINNGIAFGKGRQSVTFGSFLGGSQSKRYLPSPDKYTIPIQLSKVSGKIFGRLPTDLDYVVKKKTPGPGAYDPKFCNLADSGSYILSQMKNNISPRLHTINSVSLDRINKKRTGSDLSPTTYNLMEKGKGVYINSKHKNILGRSFTKSKRVGPQNSTSAPGFRYKRFSQFGSYI